jgi:hypothetical protein
MDSLITQTTEYIYSQAKPVSWLYFLSNRGRGTEAIDAAIFGVVFVLVLADLTKGSRRFNLTLGVITTAVEIGAALSQSIAVGIIHRFGNHTGFLFLAAVAAAAFLLLWMTMPETRGSRKESSVSEAALKSKRIPTPSPQDQNVDPNFVSLRVLTYPGSGAGDGNRTHTGGTSGS